MVNEQLEKQKNDVIRAFCSDFVRHHSKNWPVDEELLAKEFVAHFEVPFLYAANLGKICEKLKIQFVKEKLPHDLWGSNFYFAGQRRIAVSDHPEHVGMKEHTLLHEIRELLEYEFRAIGFPTAGINTEEVEFCADEFAMYAILSCTEKTWESWTESASQIKSTWQMILAVALIFVMRSIFLLNAYSCMRHRHLDDQRPQLPPA